MSCLQMYQEMASRHRVRFPCISIIKTATIKAKDCKRDNTKQFHNSEIKFPLTRKMVRCVACLRLCSAAWAYCRAPSPTL